MAGKLPYLPLFTGDWRKDPQLCLCTPATRGVWIDLICAMHDFDRSGELRGTADQIARMARCSTVDVIHALTDLQTTGAADIQERNGVYLVRNRRMCEESRRRKSNAERQERHRNRDVTPRSRGDTEYEYENEFELFWKEFPEGRKKSKRVARESFAKARGKVGFDVILSAAKEYAQSDEGRGAYVKMPSTWLNQECWEDDRNSWRSKDSQAVRTAKEKLSEIGRRQREEQPQ